MLKRSLFILLAVLLGGLVGLTPAANANAASTVYNTPGHHKVDGRWWRTSCEKFSTTVVRCKTEIWATQVVQHNGAWVQHNMWTFNSLSYLPSERASWGSNPLAKTGSWTAKDGRRWKTECDTAATGRGACRSYVLVSTVIASGGTYKRVSLWTFNNIVLFSSSTVPAVTSIPKAAPAVTGYPVDTPVETVGEKAVEVALAEVGSRYVYGTAGPSTFDCSGLTTYAYRQFGISLSRSARAQSTDGTYVSKANLRPGDLVFYYSPVSHAAMYIGNGKIVDAANPRTGVRVTTLDSMPYNTARRVTNN